MTVDWTSWAAASSDERQAMLARYREQVRRESEDARATNYRRMDAAIAGKRPT